MREFLQLRLAGAFCAGLACAGAAVISAAPAHATGSYSPYDESASTALARYVRNLASDPKDFDSLIGAGRAALELGDAQAAAGFFARAYEVNAQSPLPQIGMGSVSVANDDPATALTYFSRAQQLGASPVLFACARGLAYDIMGQQAQAQADYRLAQGGADRDEATRRLALSLAISGNRAGALSTLSPLMARRDPAAARTRAFVLALTGDSNGAIGAINAAMPGSSGGLSPFLQRLPTLAAGQKAAAVNLGVLPDAGGPAYAAATPPQSDRLAGIDSMLRSQTQAQQAVVQQTYQMDAPVVRVATYKPAPRPLVQAVAQTPRRLWLQLASGADANALPRQFARMKRTNDELFDGIPGFVAESEGKARLLIGPFKDAGDADTFAQDLAAAHITAFQWRNSETDRIGQVVSE